jgi:hypothetical protein
MMSRNLILGLAAALTLGAAPAAAHADGFRFEFGVFGPAPGPVEVRGPHHGHPRHAVRYVPGHYETRTVAVQVPGFWREDWVPAVYREYHTRKGHLRRVVIRPATIVRVWVPARTEYRTESVWVPGYYVDGRR